MQKIMVKPVSERRASAPISATKLVAENPRPPKLARLRRAAGMVTRPRRLLTAVSNELSCRIYGNGAGFANNFLAARRLKRLQEAYSDGEVSTGAVRRAQRLGDEGYLVLEPDFFDRQLITRIHDRFLQLLADPGRSSAKASVVWQGEDVEVHRALRDPINDLPEVRELITDELQEIIRAHYRSNFDFIDVSSYRNKHLPGNYAQQQAYSNFWHFDVIPTTTLSLFLYLTDVTTETGPFSIHPIRRSKEAVRLGYRNRLRIPPRASALMNDPKQSPEIVGRAGTAVLCHPARCLHRATVPAEGKQRDVVILYFTPSDKPFRSA